MKRLLLIVLLLFVLASTAFATDRLYPDTVVRMELTQVRAGGVSSSADIFFFTGDFVNMSHNPDSYGLGERTAAFCCPGSTYPDCKEKEFNAEFFECEDDFLKATQTVEGTLYTHCPVEPTGKCLVGITGASPSEVVFYDSDNLSPDPLNWFIDIVRSVLNFFADVLNLNDPPPTPTLPSKAP